MVAPRTFPLAHVMSVEHLAPYLGASVDRLRSLESRMNSSELVTVFTVKRGKKDRQITRATGEQLLNVHRRILSLLTGLSAELPVHVNGYVRGRSTVTNASPHAGNTYLQKFDFVNFFERIDKASVSRGLVQFGVSKDAADLLAALTTVHGRLPIGFATSPALANVALYGLDRELLELANRQNLVLSRYADDLAFSGQVAFDVEADVRVIAERFGQELNDKKTKLLKYGQPQYVTGLSVSGAGGARLPRPMKRSLRQSCFYIEKFGLESHANWRSSKPDEVIGRLGGLISYARSVEPNFVDSLLGAYPGARDALFPTREESAAKRSASLTALKARVMASLEGRADEYEPQSTYGDV